MRAGEGNTICLSPSHCRDFAVGGDGGGDGSWTPLVTAVFDNDDDWGFPLISITEFPFAHFGFVLLVVPVFEMLESFATLVEIVTCDAQGDVTATSAAKPLPSSCSSSLLGRNWSCPLTTDDCSCSTMPSTSVSTLLTLTSCFLVTLADWTLTPSDRDWVFCCPRLACCQWHNRHKLSLFLFSSPMYSIQFPLNHCLIPLPGQTGLCKHNSLNLSICSFARPFLNVSTQMNWFWRQSAQVVHGPMAEHNQL